MREDEFPIIDKHVQNEINAVLEKIQKLDDPHHYIVKQDAYNIVMDIIDYYMEGVSE